ncbi:MAG: hypothetical protein ABF690_13175 [Liquorilactobacillus nagelii]|uniref:hypothetical protein n=1 Tax=Lactobacillaceae TaxID=33958 RepID=UPI0039E832B1
MKYEVGDKVRIKKQAELSEKAGTYIKNQLGEVGTVINIHSDDVDGTILRIKPIDEKMIGKFWWNAENVEVVEDEQKED